MTFWFFRQRQTYTHTQHRHTFNPASLAIKICSMFHYLFTDVYKTGQGPWRVRAAEECCHFKDDALGGEFARTLPNQKAGPSGGPGQVRWVLKAQLLKFDTDSKTDGAFWQLNISKFFNRTLPSYCRTLGTFQRRPGALSCDVSLQHVMDTRQS